MSNPVEKHYCEVDLNITTFFNFLFLKLLAKKMRITMDGGQMFKRWSAWRIFYFENIARMQVFSVLRLADFFMLR